MKEVRVPFMFNVEHGNARHAVQENRNSSHDEGVVAWCFLSCNGNLGYILELRWGWPFKTPVCSGTSGLFISWEGHLRILLEDYQGNRDASRHEAGDPGSLSSCHRNIGIPINFQEGSGIISF